MRRSERRAWFRGSLRPWLGVLILWPLAQTCSGYSVLTHEELVDLAWNDSIRPLLLNRYPGTTEAELKVAHAYAYGGCAIQDVGYYPFGKEFFSELAHYVRTGDFIASLFRNARNVYEYAFAIGALSHYLGDSIGHAEAVNPATAIAFPGLEKKFGPTITYDENPHAHVRTEFAFDIDQLTNHRFAPAAYLRFIGLKVPRELLERAFYNTYGLHPRDELGSERPAIRSYRSSVRSFIPRFAYAEAVIHRHQFPPDTPNQSFQIFANRLAHVDYEKRWGRARKGPGLQVRMLAILIRIVPKVGPLSLLAIKIPTSETEDWYVRSVNRTVDAYQRLLGDLRTDHEMALDLPNIDLDTGERVKPGAYRLTDQTYARLLEKITSTPDDPVPPGLWRDVTNYYADLNLPIATKKNHKAWKRLQAQLDLLRHMNNAEPARMLEP